MATTGTFSNLNAMFKQTYAGRKKKQSHNNININPLKPKKIHKPKPAKHPYKNNNPLKFPKKSHPHVEKYPKF